MSTIMRADYTALRIEGPSHISVVDSFFLGGGTLVLAHRTDSKSGGTDSKSGGTDGKSGGVNGLIILDNTWANYNMAHNRTVVVDERERPFSEPPVDMVMLNQSIVSII